METKLPKIFLENSIKSLVICIITLAIVVGFTQYLRFFLNSYVDNTPMQVAGILLIPTVMGVVFALVIAKLLNFISNGQLLTIKTANVILLLLSVLAIALLAL